MIVSVLYWAHMKKQKTHKNILFYEASRSYQITEKILISFQVVKDLGGGIMYGKSDSKAFGCW